MKRALRYAAGMTAAAEGAAERAIGTYRRTAALEKGSNQKSSSLLDCQGVWTWAAARNLKFALGFNI